jgi:hypothetical protein
VIQLDPELRPGRDERDRRVYDPARVERVRRGRAERAADRVRDLRRRGWLPLERAALVVGVRADEIEAARAAGTLRGMATGDGGWLYRYDALERWLGERDAARERRGTP